MIHLLNSLFNNAEVLQAEAQVLAQLTQLKQLMIESSQRLPQSQHPVLAAHYDARIQQLSQTHRQKKQQRSERRSHAQQSLTEKALSSYLLTLQQESQQDGIEKRRLKQERDSVLLPWKQAIAQTNEQIQQLTQQYKTISAAWQTRMQQAYFAALVETDRATISLPVLHEDDDLLVIDKPAGLLSVPGRRYAQQDSVTNRLRHLRPECSFLQAVHRLDQATSGLLAIALTPFAHRSLSQQFAQGQVNKSYEAVLASPVVNTSGVIALPLRADANNRPKQVVDWQHGKPSQTAYDVIAGSSDETRVRFVPQTGRTHQLRVHAAHLDGLNAPILGDRLYGKIAEGDTTPARLHLHATALQFLHPVTGLPITLSSEAPF